MQPDTMWLVEQIPGLVVGGDVTQILEMGHFPMYNVPFWPEIYNKSGGYFSAHRLFAISPHNCVPFACPAGYPETLARFGLSKRSGSLVGSPLAGAGQLH
jgi:hypothetical protein